MHAFHTLTTVLSWSVLTFSHYENGRQEHSYYRVIVLTCLSPTPRRPGTRVGGATGVAGEGVVGRRSPPTLPARPPPPRRSDGGTRHHSSSYRPLPCCGRHGSYHFHIALLPLSVNLLVSQFSLSSWCLLFIWRFHLCIATSIAFFSSY